MPRTVAKLSGLSAAGQLAFEINEVELGEVAISDASDLRSLRDAINAKTTETGVTARMGDTNAEIILTDTSGENIALSGFTSDDGAGTALSLDVDVLNADGTASTSAFTSTTTIDDTAADATVTGQVTLSSTKVFSVHTSDNTADEAFFLQIPTVPVT